MILGGGLLIGLTMGAAVFFGLPTGQLAPSPVADASGQPAALTGALAPDFTLTNTHDQSITLSRYQGRPVLINFWATWCTPCRTEMPAIEAAYQKYKSDGLAVLAVDADESKQEVVGFGNSLNLTFDLLLDPGNSVNDLYRIRAYPSSFFIGRDGLVVALQIGVMTEAQLSENLAKILPKR